MTDTRFATAGEWLLRLQEDDLSQDEFAAWLQWYEADSLNRVAFDEAQAAFESARRLPGGQREAWARDLMRPQAVDEPRRARWRDWRPGPTIAMAFTLAAIAVGVASWRFLAASATSMTATFHTPRAAHRAESLPDGSTVELGAKSSISLSFSREVRYLVLESGEAFFTVAKDAARPFVVQAGSITVRAVGTQFNVRRDGESTIVSVREGKVDIVKAARAPAVIAAPDRVDEPIHLAAGEQVAARGAAPDLAVKAVAAQAVATWRSGRLEFADEPLFEVVAAVNRYSPREIVVTDPALAGLRVTGTVGEDRVDEWLRALPAIFPVQVIDVSRQTVLISPASGG